MNQKVVVHSSKPTGWSRSTSIGSHSSSNSSSSTTSSTSAIPSPPSSEMCALTGFAYRLGSVVRNNDPNMDESDVRREAELLMSLSCSSPTEDERAMDTSSDSNHNCNSHNHNDTTNHQKRRSNSFSSSSSSLSSSSSSVSTAMSTGRITPTPSLTSVSSGGSRRDTFCFTCPSLSLDKRGTTSGSGSGNKPATMLSRTLKVDDKDAMRLSSEAMARNVIESFQKAIVWRIQSWVDSLSRVLVIKEQAVKGKLQQELRFSNEALLVKILGEIEGKVQVLEATTAFKVLNKVSQVDETGAALKKRRMGELEDRTGLEEGEYVYDVEHVLEMQCSLNIATPAGNVRIDLNVPGKINGTFFSSEDEDCDDNLTDVAIHLNTDMMASMIERSSRLAVRISSEALLKGDHRVSAYPLKVTKAPQEQYSTSTSATTTSSVATSNLPTRRPKRKTFEHSNVSGLVVMTAAREDASSPSTFGESSDSDGDHPVLLQTPHTYKLASKTICQPRAVAPVTPGTPGVAMNMNFQMGLQQTRLPPKKYKLQQKGSKGAAAVITPLKTRGPEYIERNEGPNLPILMEAAGIQFTKN